MTDAEIITGVLNGHRDLFTGLVNKYLPMVRGLCASHVRDAAAVDDLIQDVFAYGFEHLPKLRNRERFGPWLALIVRSRCIDWLRRQGHPAAQTSSLDHVDTPDERPGPLSAALRNEIAERVHIEIARLPEKTREAMQLVYVEGLSVREAARFLGVMESVAKMRVRYGRRLVGERLLADAQQLADKARDDEPLKKRIMAALPPMVPAAHIATTATSAAGIAASAKVAIAIATGAVLVVAGALLIESSKERTPMSQAGVVAPGTQDLAVNPSAKAQNLAVTPIPTAKNPTTPGESAGNTIALRGVVLDEKTMEPVPYAAFVGISIKGAAALPTAENVTVSEDGEFDVMAVALQPGEFELLCKHGLYEPFVMEGSYERGETQELRLVLRRRPCISGHVHHPDGSSAANVNILRKLASGDWSNFSMTDVDGSYIAPHDGGAIEMIAVPFWVRNHMLREDTPWIRSEIKRAELESTQSIEMDLALDMGSTIQLELETPGSQEKPTIENLLLWRNDGERTFVSIGELATTTLSHVPRGAYDLAVIAKGCEPVIVNGIQISEQPETKTISLQLEPARDSIRVRLVQHDGRPWPGQHVGCVGVYRDINEDGEETYTSEFYERTAGNGSLLTDANGECTFEGLLPGPHKLYVLNVHGVEPLEVVSPSSEVVTLRPATAPAPLTGRVFAEFAIADGRNGNAAVSRGGSETFIIQPDGTTMGGPPSYSIDLKPGENIAIFAKPGFPMGIASATIAEDRFAAGEEYEKISITLNTGGAIRGQVVNQANEPIPGIGMLVYPEVCYQRKAHFLDTIPDLTAGYLLSSGMPLNAYGDRWLRDQSRDLGKALAQGAVSDENGEYSLQHLAPGNYIVTIFDEARSDIPTSDIVAVDAGSETGPVVLTYRR